MILCYFILEKALDKSGTAKEKPRETSQIIRLGLTNAKIPLKNGIYMQTSIQANETATAKSINGLDKNGTDSKVFSSLLHSNT